MAWQIWLWLSGGLVIALFLSTRRFSTAADRPLGAFGDSAMVGYQSVWQSVQSTGQPETIGVASAGHQDRLGRYIEYLEARERSRLREGGRLLDCLNGAIARVGQCAEVAGANQRIQAEIDQTLDALRWTAHEIRMACSPLGQVQFEAGTLCEGLRALAAQVECASMLHVDTRFDEALDPSISPARSLQVLHLVREALLNAMIHGGAKRVAVKALVKNEKLIVSISDDGQGFDPAILPGHDQGLSRMRARAEAARGLLQVESALAAGTVVTLTIPI